MPFTKGMNPWNKGKKTGIIPKTAFKKGERVSVSTEFKKGNPPWNKGKHIYNGGGFKKGENIGNKNPNWKGGITHNAKGYIEERYAPYKYKLQHRLIMEKYLGRKLDRFEVVHHKDFNKSNNSIDNLEVMDIGDHNRLHHLHTSLQADEPVRSSPE